MPQTAGFHETGPSARGKLCHDADRTRTSSSPCSPRAQKPARRRPERRRAVAHPLGHEGSPSNGAGDVTARQVDNFAHLINDLLDVSRITTRGRFSSTRHSSTPTPVLHSRRRGREANRQRAEARTPARRITSTDLRLEADSTRARADSGQPPHECRQIHTVRGRIQLIAGSRGGGGHLPGAGQRTRHPCPTLLRKSVRPLRPGRPLLARSEGGSASVYAGPLAGGAARRHCHRDERRDQARGASSSSGSPPHGGQADSPSDGKKKTSRTPVGPTLPVLVVTTAWTRRKVMSNTPLRLSRLEVLSGP